jgi:TRAP-type C4-dicarboxylate transport system permease small subunit
MTTTESIPDTAEMMNILRVIDRALARVEGWFIVGFLAIMVTLTFLQVILRGLFIYGHLHWANTLMAHLDWAEPLVRLSVLWITFLGASLVTGENKHIKIDLVSGMLPRRWLPYRELLLCIASALVSLLMIKASLGYITMEMNSGVNLILTVPMWVGQLILPAGFSLLVFRFLFRGLLEAMAIRKGGGA